jgi:hypothetical protein
MPGFWMGVALVRNRTKEARLHSSQPGCLVRQLGQLRRQFPRRIRLQIHTDHKLACKFSGLLHQQLQLDKGSQRKHVGGLACNGIEFKGAPSMNFRNGLTQRPRKRHVIAARNAARRIGLASCNFVAHEAYYGRRGEGILGWVVGFEPLRPTDSL